MPNAVSEVKNLNVAVLIRVIYFAIVLSVSVLFLADFSAADILPASVVTVQNGNQVTFNVTYREMVCVSNVTIRDGRGMDYWVMPYSQMQNPCTTVNRRSNYIITRNFVASGNYSFYISVLDTAGNFRGDTKPVTILFPSQPGCGDRIVNASMNEQCDDGNTRSGDGCNSQCQSELCGNSRIDLGEVCDGSNMNSVSCDDFPAYSGGAIQCSSDCRRFTFSNCTSVQPPLRCGNGVIDVGEQCDGSNWGQITNCVSFDSTFTGGVLTCDPRTCRFKTDQCRGPVGGTCGDGQLAVNEQCDGRARLQCSDFDSFFGTGIACTSNCTYDTNRCQKSNARCGDGEINLELDENCDGTTFDPRMQTCQDLTYYY